MDRCSNFYSSHFSEYIYYLTDIIFNDVPKLCDSYLDYYSLLFSRIFTVLHKHYF